MSFKDTLEKILIKFGKNNSPMVIAIGIAIAKGIVRPTLTMMDKKESYETKRYTAIREGLTELIAIPVYYLSGLTGKKLAQKIAVPKNYMRKSLWKRHMNGDKSAEVEKALKHAEELAKINLPKVTSTMTFIGVCASALLIIPFCCSVAIKPIMKKIENKKNIKKEINASRDVKNIQVQHKATNTFRSLYNPSCGMKIGGV